METTIQFSQEEQKQSEETWLSLIKWVEDNGLFLDIKDGVQVNIEGKKITIQPYQPKDSTNE